MSFSSLDVYVILPIQLSEDAPAIQSVFTRSFGSDSLSGDIARDNTAPELNTFANGIRAIRQLNVLEGRNEHGMRSVVGKLVHTPSNEIIGVVCLLAPADAIEQTEVLKPLPLVADDQAIPEGGQAALDMWNSHNEQAEVLSEEIMGPDRSKEWWYLSALSVVPEYQRRGLGGQLVRWSIEQARKDVEAKKNLGIKGLWLIASAAGLRTYQEEGMKVIGDGWLGAKDGKKGRQFTWLTLEM